MSDSMRAMPTNNSASIGVASAKPISGTERELLQLKDLNESVSIKISILEDRLFPILNKQDRENESDIEKLAEEPTGLVRVIRTEKEVLQNIHYRLCTLIERLDI